MSSEDKIIIALNIGSCINIAIAIYYGLKTARQNGR